MPVLGVPGQGSQTQAQFLSQAEESQVMYSKPRAEFTSVWLSVQGICLGGKNSGLGICTRDHLELLFKKQHTYEMIPRDIHI